MKLLNLVKLVLPIVNQDPSALVILLKEQTWLCIELLSEPVDQLAHIATQVTALNFACIQRKFLSQGIVPQKSGKQIQYFSEPLPCMRRSL